MSDAAEILAVNPEDELPADDMPREEVERWISFYLGEECYAVEVKKVREILRIGDIVPVPDAPHFVLGITNIRGSVVTVIDGRRRIDITDGELTGLSRMIIMEYRDEAVGMVVDRVADVADFPVSAIDPNPKANAHEGLKYIKGVVAQDDKLIIVLNIERFIGGEQNAEDALF